MAMLITGGAGFIGFNFVQLMVERGESDLTVLDACTYAAAPGTVERLENLGVRLEKGDVGDRSFVERVLPGHDTVVHFAAESHVDRSLVDPDVFMRTNVLGTNVLCDIARRNDVERFLHISTDEVYGSVEDGSSVETDSLEPRSPYSASKAGAELTAMAYRETYDLPVIITRSSNNYGPFQFPEKLIPLFITNLFAGRSVPVYGDGLNVRDWIHVRDNCEGVAHVLAHAAPGDVYNIGGGNGVANIDMTRKLLAACGADDSSIEWVEDRAGHDRRYSIDCGKAADLGWTPRIPLEDGLAATVEWYRANESWWSPLT